jgi:hypothetical protein
MHPGDQAGLSIAMHKPHDGGEEDVHLLRQEQVHQEEACDQGGAQDDHVIEEEAQ